ncbi:CAP domain-containing protein [Phenylobacterium terrae]|uniref:CAP domain-containing protein n=1 Tax=Phenylobacterium terrae TaxID=2665495 RepID=A0ABW4N6U3_9CAUL
MSTLPHFATPDRRRLLGGLALALCAPALAHAALRPGEPQPWLDYEARLRGRLGDAGGGRFQAGTAEALLAETNAVRHAAGRGELQWSAQLALAARAHAADLAARGYVEHLSPEGFDPSHRLSLLSRRLLASTSENIAVRTGGAPPTASDLMGVWRKSRPHWTGLMLPTHTHAAFGVVQAGRRTIAVGLYARPDGTLAQPAPFRLEDEADLVRAVASARPELRDFELTDPISERRMAGPWPTGEDFALPRGVYQLRPHRPVPGGTQILWGPIFVRL